MPSVLRKANASLLALLGLVALASAAAPKPVVESPSMFAKDKIRLVDLTADLNGSKQLFLMVAELDGIACDWANWIDPEVVLVDGTVVDLTKLKWKEAQSLGTTRIGKNYDSKPMKIAGKEYTIPLLLSPSTYPGRRSPSAPRSASMTAAPSATVSPVRLM